MAKTKNLIEVNSPQEVSVVMNKLIAEQPNNFIKSFMVFLVVAPTAIVLWLLNLAVLQVFDPAIFLFFIAVAIAFSLAVGVKTYTFSRYFGCGKAPSLKKSNRYGIMALALFLIVYVSADYRTFDGIASVLGFGAVVGYLLGLYYITRTFYRKNPMANDKHTQASSVNSRTNVRYDKEVYFFAFLENVTHTYTSPVTYLRGADRRMTQEDYNQQMAVRKNKSASVQVDNGGGEVADILTQIAKAKSDAHKE